MVFVSDAYLSNLATEKSGHDQCLSLSYRLLDPGDL